MEAKHPPQPLRSIDALDILLMTSATKVIKIKVRLKGILMLSFHQQPHSKPHSSKLTTGLG